MYLIGLKYHIVILVRDGVETPLLPNNDRAQARAVNIFNRAQIKNLKNSDMQVVNI